MMANLLVISNCLSSGVTQGVNWLTHFCSMIIQEPGKRLVETIVEPIRYWRTCLWVWKWGHRSILLCACYDCVACVCERCAWNDGGSAAGCDKQVPGRQIANLDPDSFPLTRLVIRCLGSSHTHCNNAGNGVWSWLPPPRRRWSRLWEPRRRRTEEVVVPPRTQL